MEFKQSIIERFKYIYTKPELDEDETHRKLISEEEAFSKEFGWYSLLYVAANERYIDINNVLESPAIEFLNFCNFYTRKCYLDMKRIKSK